MPLPSKSISKRNRTQMKGEYKKYVVLDECDSIHVDGAEVGVLEEAD
jgi:hypothetical protein